METCDRCKQIIMPQDYAARSASLGGPGLHVRRFMCACGCKSVQFYTVMNVSKIRSSSPKPGAESNIPLYDFPIFKAGHHVNA
ncbi:hypothetical protein [Methylobacter sp.]|uniref:hypothetical protein n=1 Tax=Methylobacter sp. TaxID=2051955 RepID=UPI002FDE8C32